MPQTASTNLRPGPCIALTFDDGPHPTNTPALIQILAERIIPATFFVLGSNAQRCPELLRLMDEAGHEIGNHGWSHSSFTSMADDVMMDELQRTHNLIRDLTTQECAVYRPPYGAIHARQQSLIAKRFRYRISLWNVDSLDWKTTRVDDVVRTTTTIRPNAAVLLFHDFSNVTCQALPWIIDKLLMMNSTFYTASKILSHLER